MTCKLRVKEGEGSHTLRRAKVGKTLNCKQATRADEKVG